MPNPEPAERLSPDVLALSELCQAELGELSPAARSAGLRRLHERLERSARPFQFGPRLALVLAVVVALLGIGVGRFALRGSEPAQLSYSVDGQAPVADLLEAKQAPRSARFSDGSELTVLTGARARVSAVTAAGANVALEKGKVALQVTPRPHSAWSVSAGPFLIRVTGTRFSTDWQPNLGHLQVLLEHGSLLVSGPLSDEPIRLRAGQQLVVRLREREVTITELGAALGTQAAQPSAPAAEAENKLSVEEAPASAAKSSAAGPAASGSLRWPSELAAGNFDGILEDAKARGVDQALRSTTSEELAALADAARFKQQPALARRALLAQRERFPASSRARDAAFLMGRLEEASGAPAQALVWYDRYLSEAARGTYASEAMGRKMLVIQTTQGKEKARATATEYLKRFPAGAYISTAKALTQQP